MKITVSVVVPIYNVEALLPRCLDSIIAQTLNDIEIICVNDASPDNSLDILREYEAKYSSIKVIDLKENIRQGGARNRGIDIAQGEYLAFVDSDDYVAPTMFEKLYNKAKEVDSDVVSSGYYGVNSVTGERMSQFPLDFDVFYVSGEIDTIKRKQIVKDSGSVWIKVYKTTFLKSTGIRFPEKMQYEDNYFVPAVMMQVGRFDYVAEYLYYYCANPDSTTKKRNNFQGFADRQRALQMTIDHLTNNISLLGNDFKLVRNLEMGMLNNSLTLYGSTFDNVKLSQLSDLRRNLSLRKIFDFGQKYNVDTSRFVIFKIKIRLIVLFISSRLFKFIFIGKK